MNFRVVLRSLTLVLLYLYESFNKVYSLVLIKYSCDVFLSIK